MRFLQGYQHRIIRDEWMLVDINTHQGESMQWSHILSASNASNNPKLRSKHLVKTSVRYFAKQSSSNKSPKYYFGRAILILIIIPTKCVPALLNIFPTVIVTAIFCSLYFMNSSSLFLYGSLSLFSCELAFFSWDFSDTVVTLTVAFHFSTFRSEFFENLYSFKRSIIWILSALIYIMLFAVATAQGEIHFSLIWLQLF